MKHFKNSVILSCIVILVLMGCVAEKSGGPSATLPEQDSLVAAVADHRPSKDTVDWQSIPIASPGSSPVDREGPGEAMGIIGPIIAIGGSGSKTYIAIYDPGGVFIGALYLKEAKQDPTRLENLLHLAHARGEIQNTRTVNRVSALRFLDLALAAREKESL